MFRSRTLLFVAKSQADVARNGMSVTPNPVSSYTKLPISVKGMLGFVDAAAEQNEKDEKRKLIGDLLRGGAESKQTASILMDKLRAQQTGKTTDISGPVTLSVVDVTGEVRKIETFVSFGSDQDEKTPLGKLVQLGLQDLKKLGVSYDYTTNDLRFTAATTAPSEDRSRAEPDHEHDHRRVAPEDRKLAGEMLPKQPFSTPAPAASPSTPLAYDT